jgi:hypothetical protein
MLKVLCLIILPFFTTWAFCQSSNQKIISTDINNFWAAYDKISATKDSVLQIQYIKELYLDKGTDGLKSLLQVKNYTAKEYVDVINKYPKFWESLRENSLSTQKLYPEIAASIEKLKEAYPSLKPSTIYFLIGVFRTGGTAHEDRVLIGSEYSLGDETTVTEEFSEQRKNFYKDFKPKQNIGLTCTHEYIHSQQKQLVDDLLYSCLYEGVAEFISCLVTGKKSNGSSISFGKANHEKVVTKFLEDIYFGNFYNWLWGENRNELKVRDLGYYIGYEICERYYNLSTDKRKAIKELIELDYTNDKEVERIVDTTKIFPTTLSKMLEDYNKKRPAVISVLPLNKSKKIKPGLVQLTITFSQEMDTNFRGFGYGPLGENYSYKFKKLIGWSNNNKTLTIEVEVAPNRKYQVLVNNYFRNKDGFRLNPFLLEFETMRK